MVQIRCVAKIGKIIGVAIAGKDCHLAVVMIALI